MVLPQSIFALWQNDLWQDFFPYTGDKKESDNVPVYCPVPFPCTAHADRKNPDIC